MSALLDLTAEEIRSALDELARLHHLILGPQGEVEMALPFAAAPTPYLVTDGERTWWANCAWDALAIAPLVGVQTTMSVACVDCGEHLRLSIAPQQTTVREPAGVEPVVHFALPAREWWRDIRFT
jgi:hypothetical protein